jgi:hypothetical protein
MHRRQNVRTWWIGPVSQKETEAAHKPCVFEVW